MLHGELVCLSQMIRIAQRCRRDIWQLLSGRSEGNDGQGSNSISSALSIFLDSRLRESSPILERRRQRTLRWRSLFQRRFQV